MVGAPSPTFSPYSRGWSLDKVKIVAGDYIFPVFAGMVPQVLLARVNGNNFPRIRGDGPRSGIQTVTSAKFSPYSRGWSWHGLRICEDKKIFPVFAGMVPSTPRSFVPTLHFPRIRGDGPDAPGMVAMQRRFSPYSRGWSQRQSTAYHRLGIFPVFAGMVPGLARCSARVSNFPRIRGDGPWGLDRGCCLWLIFPVFAGMVPHFIN